MAVRVEIRPSLMMLGFLLIAFIGAFVCLVAAAIAVTIKVIVAILLGIWGYKSIYNSGLLKSANAVIEIQQLHDNEWELVTNSGKKILAKLVGQSYVARFLVVLNFNYPDKFFKRSVIVWSDAAAPEVLRRLRVNLRFASF